MEIEARLVGVGGPHGPLLQPTSLRVRTGTLTLVAGEPGTGHTALALALAGQLRPDTGEVRLDGAANRAALRSRVAVVDAPQVTEPDDGLRLAAVVAEELALTRAPAGRRAVASWLAERDAGQYAGRRFRTVPGAVRTRLLTELAAARPGIQMLILDCPDRHTDDVESWWRLAGYHAEQGRGVVVLCSHSSARLLDVTPVRLGHHNEPEPAATASPARKPRPAARKPEPPATEPAARPAATPPPARKPEPPAATQEEKP